MTTSTGLVSCSWPVAFQVQSDATWVRGTYLVQLSQSDGPQTWVPFVLRDDSAKPDVLAVLPTATWQAYNAWSGESLYDDQLHLMPSGRAFQVSFDRPYLRDHGAGDLLSHDRSLIQWFEAQGIDIAYVTDGDLERNPTLATGIKVLALSGHDEYWSKAIRDAADKAVAAGTSLVSLGADTGYWQVRYGAASDGRTQRIITCYKEDAPQGDPVGRAAHC